MHDEAGHPHPHVLGYGDPALDHQDVNGLEQHTLTSVGIDIGSSTSQVMVSRLTIRRRGSDLSTEFVVTDREVSYAGRPVLTPYSGGTRMDVGALEQFVRRSYDDAGITPPDVDTGVVVVTGEALNKENAEELAGLVSRWSGDFICVSAGANHEAVLAAHGSGSVALSERIAGTVLNVDVGGGTTKVSVIDRGRIVAREAFSAGARLVVWDAAGRLVRLESPAHVYAAHTGHTLRLGERPGAGVTDRIAELMASVIVDAIVPGGPVHELRRRLMVTQPAESPAGGSPAIDRIVFSGGVSEYLDGRETAAFGDLGPMLGDRLRHLLDRAGLGDRVTPAEHRIRATVIGASEFSVQASGQTWYVSDDDLLPVRNLPVAHLEFAPDAEPDRAVAEALSRHDRTDLADPLALAVRFHGMRNYTTLRRYADALVRAAAGHPLYVVLRDDLAMSFGRLAADELGHRGPLVVVDGVTVGDLDYLDIGRPLGSTRSIPVTIKSLAFSR